MEENRTEVLVGTGVLLVAVAFLVYLFQATQGGFSAGGTVEYTASFRSVDGIAVGSEVRLAGVKMGTITALELNPQTFRADARIAVSDSIELPDDTAVIISSEGLLGGNFVEIVPGGSPFTLEPGDEILDTQGSVSLVTLLMRFVGGGE